MRSTVNVGIVGLGPVWETRYLPALRNLARRIRVRAIYDPVASRAERAVAELPADVAPGIVALLSRPDVQSVLLLDPAWQQGVPLSWLCARSRAAYVAGSLGDDAAALERLHERACAHSQILMPEFSRRFTPTTGRLLELIATRLGRPRHVEIDAVLPAPPQPAAFPRQGAGLDSLVGLFDWCRYVIRTAPESVLTDSGEADATDRVVTVHFRKPRGGGEAAVARLRLRAAASDAPAGGFAARVVCQHGEATIEGTTTIIWSNDSQSASESLTSERSEVEVMLDHFCRRVAGGLVPVADVQDICRSLRLIRAAEESRRTGRPISMHDPGA